MGLVTVHWYTCVGYSREFDRIRAKMAVAQSPVGYAILAGIDDAVSMLLKLELIFA